MTTFAVVCALSASAMAAGVGGGNNGNGNNGGFGHGGKSGFGTLKAYVPSSLLSSIQQNPRQSFDVIVSGDPGQKSHGFIQKILQDQSGNNNEDVQSGNVKDEFQSVIGGRMTLTGWQVLFLAKSRLVKAILANETVKRSGSVQSGNGQASNKQLWPWAAGAPVNWYDSGNTPNVPTIAIVDSGIDATRADVAGRVLGQVNLASLPGNKPAGDGAGHGTFVAGIAAGAAPGYAGVAPKANLLSIDIMNDQGQATVADVVAAADWILKNKATYNIEVANFSLHAVNRASIMFDPIDQAVEKLWLNGVVVVAASGNYAVNGANSGVQYAPGNDPFVITVGATDIGTNRSPVDDLPAPFSAWGYTPDGFMKPELGAPGRYMIGPVPTDAHLYSERPANVVSAGYMRLSGTSFAAPVVAGEAAMLIAQHPDWNPDQVKGALMLSATPEPLVKLHQLGVGTVNIAAARRLKSAPNPNAALNKFVVTATDGTAVFNAAAWQTAAKTDAAWADAAWSDAAWSSAAWKSAAWSDAAWADAAWADAAWASAAWGTAAWSDAAWSDAAWADAAWADGADGEPVGTDPITIDPADEAAALTSLGIVDPISPIVPAPPALLP